MCYWGGRIQIRTLTLPSTRDSPFSTAIGGGLDYRLIKGLGWRVQGDYLQTRFFNSTQSNFRFSTGLALHF